MSGSAHVLKILHHLIPIIVYSINRSIESKKRLIENVDESINRKNDCILVSSPQISIV